MKKLNIEFIGMIIAVIISILLTSFIIYRYVNSKSQSEIFIKNFHRQIKNEHIKIEKLSKEIDKHPNYYVLYLNRADAKFKKQEIFQDFVKIFRPYNEYKIVNESDIKYDLNKAKELNPNIDVNLKLGFIELKNENYDKAINLLSNYIKANLYAPDLYLAYYYRGLCYYQTQKIQNAIIDLNTSINLNPQFSKPYTALGNIYNFYEIDNNSDNQIAYNYYDKASRLNNSDIESHFRKVYDLAQSGNADIKTIMSEYYNALNTDYGKYCSLLYWTMGISSSINQDVRIKMAHSHYKSANILSRAIKTCKYCLIPNEYYEDIKDIQWDSFSLLINNSVNMGEIGKARKYYRQCKWFALMNSCNKEYCDSLLDEELR